MQDPRPTKTRRLRELIDKQTVMLPGAFNALTHFRLNAPASAQSIFRRRFIRNARPP
jgi:hypothetical protein